MKADAPNLIKFKHLKRLLGRPDYVIIGLLEALWIATAKNARMGDIGRFSDVEIASILEWEGDASELVNALRESRWLDSVEGPQRYVIHDWYDNAAQYIVQWINRHLGFTPEQLRTPEGRRDARNAWLKTVGLNMQTDSKHNICISTHTQIEAESHSHACANPSYPSPTQINKSIDRLDRPTNAVVYEPDPIDADAWADAVPDFKLAGDALSRGRPLSKRNRETVVRCVLVLRRRLPGGEYITGNIVDEMSGGLLAESIERPFGYFRSSVINACKHFGVDFHRAAAAIEIPPQLLHPPPKVEAPA